MAKQTSWEPTKKQQQFLELPYSIKEGFYAGAVGAGKSDVLLLYPIIHRFHENPEFKGLFLRRTFPELRNEIIPRSKSFFTMFGATYNKNEKCWEFPSGKNRSKSPQGAGALLFFGHCELEDDVHNYDSMQPNYVAFDELTSFSEWQYLYIVLERNRTKTSSNLPAIARSGSNPGNVGHNWVRKRFIEPCPEGNKLLKGPSGVKRIFIQATIDDNPHIDPEYRKSLEALPEAEKQAKLYGKWDAFEGTVFEEFRDRHFPDEPNNALHVIEPFDIPEWWPKIVAGDWGYDAMTWIGYGAVSPDRRLYLYREQCFGGYKQNKVKIEEWAPYVKEFLDAEEPEVIKFCQSVRQSRGTEHTVEEQIEIALGRPIELTGNSAGSRVATKILLHEYLRWRPKYTPKTELRQMDANHAQWLLRNKSMNEYKKYISSFSPSEDEKIPKLQIFNTCKVVINTIKTRVYAKSRSDGTRPEDVMESIDDDPYDGCRYLVDSAEQYFDTARQQFREVEKKEALQKRLNETQDWTAFYRNARRMDADETPVIVRRFH